MASERIRNILADPSCPQDCDISPLPLAEGLAALECRDLHFSYHDGKEAVAGVSFSIEAGESVALCGPNGSGKTTLLKLLSGLLFPSAGKVLLGGMELTPKSAPQAFRSIGLLFQDSQDQLFCNDVAEDVAFGLKNLGLHQAEINQRVDMALKLTEATHLKDRPIHHLSGGEMKRVALAGLIAMRSPILVLDEPNNGLDPASNEHLLELVEHLHRDHGYAFLTVTHKIDVVPSLANRVIVMESGKVLADGSTQEVLTNIPLLEQARLTPPSITKYFYERRKRQGSASGSQRPLPLTVEEALALGENGS
jgi:cobalt/nickel transport system ATP-binding protein